MCRSPFRPDAVRLSDVVGDGRHFRRSEGYPTRADSSPSTRIKNRILDLNSLEELLTLQGQGSMFDSVTFSPDGNLLASTNARGILHVWRAPSFEEIAQHDARSK